MRSRRALLIGFAGAALLATACGPDVPSTLGIQGYPSSVVLGRTKPSAPSPAGAPSLAPLLLNPPPALRLPPLLPPLATQPKCVRPAAGTPPVDTAPASITSPPQPGYYFFNEDGRRFDGSATQVAKQLATVRLVTQVNVQSTGSNVQFSYVVVSYLFQEYTATAYSVVDNTLDPTSTQNGLFITAIATRVPGEIAFQQMNFSRPLRVLPFPVVPGARIAGSAFNTNPIDSRHRVEYDVVGSVVKETGVSLCGSAHDAWEVQLGGHLFEPGQSVNTSLTYDFATQLGGLALQDRLVLAPTTPLDQQINEDLTSVMDLTKPEAVGS